MSDAAASDRAAGPRVSIRGITKRYGRTLALDGVDLDIGAGELFALLGPNGAGKTTLIHILCTILKPDGGTATLAGYDIVRTPLRARKRLGVVFQEPSLDDRLTVFENLNFHGLVYQVPRRVRLRRIDEMLAIVELSKWRDSLVRTLSSGMKRRLEIARALVHDAAILFLDEPTVGLDAQSRERIWHYLDELRRQRELTVIVTTHYIEEVESADRVAIIDHGKILAEGTPGTLKAAHGRERIRVSPRQTAIADRIRARYPLATLKDGGDVVLPVTEDVSVDEFLASFGSGVSAFVFERPSLESVFMTLTGRDLRDAPASQAERTRAFGRRGGELTR